jgi:hypothetical protein
MVIKLRKSTVNHAVTKVVYSNPQAQKDADAAETKLLKAALSKFLKELGRYTVWVLAITMMTMITRNSISLHYTNHVIKSSIESTLISAQSGNSVSIWNVLNGLSNTFLSSTFLFEDQSFAKTYRKKYDHFGNIILGNVVLRQVRVKNSVCPSIITFEESYSCSPEFSFFDEAQKFEKPWESDWSPPTQRFSEFNYQTAQQLEEWFAFAGKNAVYPGNGFVATFSDKDQAEHVLAELQSLNWIDFLTRAVFLDLVAYSPNADVYNRVIDLNFYPEKLKLFDLINIGLQLIVVALLGYYTKEEVTAIYNEGFRHYFSQIWNTFDVVNILLIFALCILRCILVVETNSIFENSMQSSASKIGSIMILAENENMLLGTVSLLMWFKMLKYLSAHKPLGKVGRAVSFVFEDVIAVVVVTMCCMFGFAVGQSMVAGFDVQRFSTISISMTAHFCSLVGGYFGDTFEDLSTSSSAGAVLFWVWYLFSQLILLNIFVIIFEYGLLLVMREDSENKGRTIFSVVKELDVVKKVLTVIQTQEQGLKEMEAALEMADDNDDGLIDEEELKAFLSSNKDATAIFHVQDEKEMMAMFDQDGSGKLDAEEMGNSCNFHEHSLSALFICQVSHSNQASCASFWARKREI